MSGGVRVVTAFTLLGDDGRSWQVPTWVEWSPGDPLAVRLWFPRDHAEWFVARELLIAALTSDEAGDGDVQFWCPQERTDCVGLVLDSPSGHAEFHAPREALIELIVASEPGFRAAVDAWQETWLEGVLA